MSNIALYCFFDTSDMKSSDDFEKWYLALNYVKDVFKTSLNSMLILNLKDDINHQQYAFEIRQRLCKCYESENLDGFVKQKDSHIYSSVFVIGDRMRNGAYAGAGESNIFSNIVLLSNTAINNEDAEWNKRRLYLYGQEKPAVALAYSCSMKPLHSIILITLKGVAAKLLEILRESVGIEATRLADILKVHSGKSVFYEEIYNELRSFLPDDRFLEQLPGKADLERSTYREVNNVSDGCLDAFLRQNHFEKVNDQLTGRKEYLLAKIKDAINAEITADQLSAGISDETLTDVFNRAEMSLAENDGLRTREAIRIKIIRIIAQNMRNIIKEAVVQLKRQSDSCIESFNEIRRAIDLTPPILETGTGRQLVSFYSDKTNRYLTVDRTKELFNRIFQASNSKSDILNILYETLKNCFESDPDYRLSYTVEMERRLGIADANNATTQIIGELMDNMGDKVRYSSATVLPDRVFEAYLLNIEGSDIASQNMLYERLKARDLIPGCERTFFNTYDNNMVESFWFYICRKDELMGNYPVG